MVVISRLLFVHHKGGKAQDEPHVEYSVEQPVKRRSSLLVKGDVLKTIFTPKQERGHWVPTLSGIIKAGDEGICTSTLFSNLQELPGPLPLKTLQDAFANELRARPTSERSNYPSEISKFLAATRGDLRRSISVRANHHQDIGVVRSKGPSRPPRNSVDLSEIGLVRARSRRVTPVLVSVYGGNTVKSTPVDPTSWAGDVQHSLYFDGRAGISVTAKELATLSIILATPADLVAARGDNKSGDINQANRSNMSTAGAHGISISGAAMKNGEYRLSLSRHKRSISQLPARGSGYSTLFAKHLACGSLPFLIDDTINSILITEETLVALRSGSPLHLVKTSEQTSASAFLSSLPSARLSTFHTLNPSPHSAQQKPQTLLAAIASLPFTGGLTPLSTSALTQTISFIASGGLVAGRLLQRLDALIEKTHRHSPHLHLFGPILEDKNAGLLFREREKLGRLATGALTSQDEALADKVARVRRYITLVERLMSLVPGMQPQDVLAAVRNEVRKQIEQSYIAALAAPAAHTLPFPLSTAKRTSQYSSSTQRSKRSARSASTYPPTPPSVNPPSPIASDPPSPFSRTSNTFPTHNLGTVAESILKLQFPLDVRSVATVVRLVLVAWTLSVGHVAWNDGEVGFQIWRGEETMKGVERMVLS